MKDNRSKLEKVEQEITVALYGLPEEWNQVEKEYGMHDANYGVLGLRAKRIMRILKENELIG